VNAKPNSNGAGNGRTPFQRFQALAKGLIQVPKAEIDRKAKQEKAHKKYPKPKQ